MTDRAPRKLIEGNPVLIVVDIQGGASSDESESSMPFMDGYGERMEGAPALVAAARRCGVPVIFFQEAHRRDLVDFGRELDGAEGVHLLEGDPGTEISAELGVGPDDYVIRNAMEYLQTGARRSSDEVVAAFEKVAEASSAA